MLHRSYVHTHTCVCALASHVHYTVKRKMWSTYMNIIYIKESHLVCIAGNILEREMFCSSCRKQPITGKYSQYKLTLKLTVENLWENFHNWAKTTKDFLLESFTIHSRTGYISYMASKDFLLRTNYPWQKYDSSTDVYINFLWQVTTSLVILWLGPV